VALAGVASRFGKHSHDIVPEGNRAINRLATHRNSEQEQKSKRSIQRP